MDRDCLLTLLALMAADGRGGLRAARALRDGRTLADLIIPGAFAPADRDLRLAERQRWMVEQLGLAIVPFWALPPALRGSSDPPLCLFVRGEAALLDRAAVAIVGARAAHAGPERWAAARAAAASAHGLAVVSGGARGIDAAAHRGALAAGGATVAFLGVAADRIYPGQNRELFRRMLAAGGALVSEVPPAVPTFASAHAARNRLIAAYARLLLVAEARRGSGSLGTAAAARRLGVAVRVAPAAVGGERRGIADLLAREAATVWEGDDELARVARPAATGVMSRPEPAGNT